MRESAKRGGAESIKHVWLWWSGDASDAIDNTECIISSTKGSGDYLESLSTRGGSLGRGQERGDYVTGSASHPTLREMTGQVRPSSWRTEAARLAQSRIGMEQGFSLSSRQSTVLAQSLSS